MFFYSRSENGIRQGESMSAFLFSLNCTLMICLIFLIASDCQGLPTVSNMFEIKLSFFFRLFAIYLQNTLHG